MANICSFTMQLRGKEENIRAVIDAIKQNGDIWIGRGADVYDEEVLKDESDDYHVEFCADTKWAISASLIDDAHSMEQQRTTGKGDWYWHGGMENVKEFLDIFEACERFHVNMEAYSKEDGCEIQEHVKYDNGDIINDCVSWHVEYDFDNLGKDPVEEGGFEWDFDVSVVDDAKIEEASKNGKDEMEL